MDVPNWLWQGLTVAALWEAGRLIVKHRDEIASRLRGRAPVLLSGTAILNSECSGELSVGFDETATLNAVVSRRMRTTYNPFTGQWVTSEIPPE